MSRLDERVNGLPSLQEQFDSIQWKVKPSNLVREAARKYNVAQLRKTYADGHLLKTGMVKPEELI